MTKTLNRATTQELSLLAEPKSIELLRLLSKNRWLSLDVKELEQVFGSDDHPARQALKEEARTGGKHGAVQVALVLAFLAFSIYMTSIMPLTNPAVFTMWGAIGIAIGLVVSRYPAVMDSLRKGRKAP